MPILQPSQLQEIQKQLKPALSKPTRAAESESELQELLREKGLSAAEILERLEHEMSNAETGSVRVKAAELGLKLNGYLQKDESQQAPFSVTIVIQDTQGGDLNSILVPR